MLARINGTAQALGLNPSPSLTCPACSRPVDVKSQHVVVTGSAVRVYCSEACKRGLVPEARVVEPPRRRTWWWIAAGFAVGSTCAVLAYTYDADDDGAPLMAAIRMPAVAPPPVKPVPVVDDSARKAEEALLEELKHDAWIHPLAGPRRKMPVNHTQAFGASREHLAEPPPECLSGHCGVDVAADNIWGEQVHAVHDGVVAWVDRGPNEDNGGIFVKLAHRDGSLFSWYFHLAAVPRWIRPGVKIKVGQVIGVVGDTGVKQSAPHLHFAMTVKAGKRERYIDPEPLIAIWPMWIPDEHGSGTMTTVAPAGVPARGPDRARRPKPVEPPKDEPKPESEATPGDDAPN
jgi:Peptidase family M23